MNGSYLLDTNIVIALFANDPVVLQKISSVSQIFVPSIVLGELYYGANRSAHSKINIALIDSFALKNSVLVSDIDTARHYGRIKDFLRAKGTPVPENDIWIAALAKQHQMTLVSRDKHFHCVKGLDIDAWQ